MKEKYRRELIDGPKKKEVKIGSRKEVEIGLGRVRVARIWRPWEEISR